ncbi:craniofacial development protein 1 [Asbolus verrucosus]|uniref:Craniofacial development protein 1 n=1 Tax=Asbolus verrucosus TaxID=1661398 RepID=A0A482VHJ2_ASBVE|nr:craniofacial development protein 1 [Asbolus verrucosus]
MNTEQFSNDDDTSDEDYDPQNQTEEVVSEVDSDGNLQEDFSEKRGIDDRKRKRTKTSKNYQKKLQKVEKDTSESSNSLENKVEQLTEEERKKKEDDIWADFMKDTGFQSRSNIYENTEMKKVNPPVKASSDDKLKKSAEKMKITQVFKFAGEEVEIEKEVEVDSAEARSTSRGLSGISSVLGQLGKKPKISTLEKSKLDWDKFKKEENLEEELQTYNKGRNGYLERQDFLQRADLRQFEIEKEIRTIQRNRRTNNLL